ncbi:MAG TPA: hypothetical protein DER56_01505 [Thermosipho africanus]|jgi:hypothetical protein|nr:hypothetical protein [Thermosipho africanus]
MFRRIKEFFSGIRLGLAIFFIKMSIRIIDKTSLEGIALVTAINTWARYLEHMYKETTGVDFYEELDKNLKKIGE